jgi:hypothetical protein
MVVFLFPIETKSNDSGQAWYEAIRWGRIKIYVCEKNEFDDFEYYSMNIFSFTHKVSSK